MKSKWCGDAIRRHLLPADVKTGQGEDEREQADDGSPSFVGPTRSEAGHRFTRIDLREREIDGCESVGTHLSTANTFGCWNVYDDIRRHGEVNVSTLVTLEGDLSMCE